MEKPSEALVSWLGHQFSPFGGFLIVQVALRINVASIDPEVCLGGIRKYVEDASNPVMPAARVVSVIAIIDYLLEEVGKEGYWEGQLDEYLRNVETGSAALRVISNALIGSHEATRAASKSTLDSWWKLRAERLHNDAIRAWENGRCVDF